MDFYETSNRGFIDAADSALVPFAQEKILWTTPRGSLPSASRLPRERLRQPAIQILAAADLPRKAQDICGGNDGLVKQDDGVI
jgi:hypothetical protein